MSVTKPKVLPFDIAKTANRSGIYLPFCVDQFKEGNVLNRDGEIVGTLDTKTVEWYKQTAKDLNCELTDVFQIF
jgi:hypothetical protein